MIVLGHLVALEIALVAPVVGLIRLGLEAGQILAVGIQRIPVAVVFLLPLGLEYNMPVAGERYRAIGKAMEVPYIDSMNDEEAALATIGVTLMDHIIVADGDYVSMADSGYILLSGTSV